MPKVSVIMPVYNAAKYLGQAIDSVLNQSMQDLELILIDDGSTDHSAALCTAYAKRDTRVSVSSRPNTGIVGALNEALSLCRADTIARMDADDICAPDRLARQLAFLDANPAVQLLGCAVDFVDSKTRRLKSYTPPCGAAEIRQELLKGNSGALIHPTLIARKAAWDRCAPYREKYKYVEDYDLFLRALEFGPLANLPDCLLKYRIHAQSTNYTRRETQIQLLRELCTAAREHLAPDTIFSAPIVPQQHPDLASVWAEWTGWAIEGKEYTTALHYALKVFFSKPTRASSRRTLLYTLRKVLRN